MPEQTWDFTFVGTGHGETMEEAFQDCIEQMDLERYPMEDTEPSRVDDPCDSCPLSDECQASDQDCILEDEEEPIDWSQLIEEKEEEDASTAISQDSNTA